MTQFCHMFELPSPDARDRRLKLDAGSRNCFAFTSGFSMERQQDTQQASFQATGVAASGFRPVR